MMRKILLCAALIFALASCEKDTSRKVVMAKPPVAAFFFMPIYEKGAPINHHHCMANGLGL